MFTQIIEKIKEYDTIIIHRHKRPDGDCIGSQMGLKNFILDNFKDKKVYAVGDEVPEYMSDLGQSDIVSDDIYKDALVIVVDTSNEDRICDERYNTGAYLIKIDHHDDSPAFGNIQYVDAESPACASIITSLVRSFDNCVISKKCAYALYFGITTDTGRFRYRGVNGTVLSNAAVLIDTGIDVQYLYNKLYVDDVNTLKLQGFVLNNFKTTPNGVVYIYFTKKLMKKYNVTKEEAGNLVNTLSSINGHLVWVAFIDQMRESKVLENGLNEKNEIRVRIRSRNVAINNVAANYRGGGHLQAAGATIYSKKEMKSMLEELDTCVKNYKAENPNAF